MCGIAGIVGEPPGSTDTIERMTRRLAHRGPDDSGIWSTAQAHLGHTRLAILDLSPAGHQPMTTGALTLVYNGEVYNYRQLRQGLSGPFRSDCDTEVVLRLFEEHGDGCVDLLRGMFAFAIWDSRRRRLFAARDRLGIKPLYYRELPGGLAFASEVKALLEVAPAQVDRTALRDYFTYKCAPPPKTIYSGISQLPPGHTLVWEGGELSTSKYWNPSLEVSITDEDEGVERLGALLREVVPEHTLADVPVGVFLSGGIDSTTLVAHLDHPRTFTLGTDVGHRDEAPKARVIAHHFDTVHHEEIAAAIDLDAALETVPAVYDEPFGDSAAWSVYLVSKMARREVKVCLSGEGGDELFAGYNRYSKYFSDRILFLNHIAGSIRPFSRGARSIYRRSAVGLDRYAAYLAPFGLPQKLALIGPELMEPDYDDLWHFRRFWRDDLDPLKRLQWADLNTELSGTLLAKVDRASMAHSLEVRPPLLDHRLVELSLALDSRLHRDIHANRGKLLLRRLMKDRIPPNHFDLPKQGFNLPVRRWLKNEPGKLPEALTRLDEAGIIRRPKRPRFTNEQAWSLLVLDRWLSQSGAL